MSHFAKIGENNTVVDIIVGPSDMTDEEALQWCINNLGGVWLQTSYNTFAGQHGLGGTPFRKNYAVIGGTYDEERDAFIPPKVWNKWILNEETCQWEPPHLPPDYENQGYFWNDNKGEWEPVID